MPPPSAIGVEHAQKFEHYGNLPAWRGVARSLRAQGADGFQLFNFFNPTRPQWWQMGEEETMAGSRNEIRMFVHSTAPSAAASLTIDRIQLELTY